MTTNAQNNATGPAQRTTLLQAINLRLTMLGYSPVGDPASVAWAGLAAPLLARQQEEKRAQPARPCPIDARLQAFLERTFPGHGPLPKLPAKTFILDQPGLARELSLPLGRDEHVSPLLRSYRLRNGVLHNPASDRRTTQGVFHVAEVGLPIPDDKLAVPAGAFVRLLERALQPPKTLLKLPFTDGSSTDAACFVTLLLRPLVAPAVPGFTAEKRMETRFFVPGSLVSNLDFIENIFGNAGDPYLPENDAALDVTGWSGHTGCVILAPHLTAVTKRELGLPAWAQATERQRRDGMCWKKEDELYNGGSAFKVCARDASGVMITLIADNYYGYCKKEVKTQISFAANLLGSAEEEHAGGALVYPSYDLGEEFDAFAEPERYKLEDVLARDPQGWIPQPEGHALCATIANTVLVPETARFNLRAQAVTWAGADGATRSIKLLAGRTYVRPSGYRVHMEPVRGEAGQWRLVGTVGEGTLCHKPCTVSGGGKSEISKAISDAILPGHVFVADFEKDFDEVAKILAADCSQRFSDPARNGTDRRPILSRERSLGSVIKLLTPSRREYTEAYNAWLKAIPQHIKELVFVVKRYAKPEWGGQWRDHFSVDIINGRPGNELKLDGRKLVVNTVRVGYDADGAWRVFGLRHDFHPVAKVQMEDDITASVVVPLEAITDDRLLAERGGGAERRGVALKFVQNCEARLFQRPDDAIHRGYDKQAEADIATPGTFLSNYEPLDQAAAQALVEDAIGFSAYTEPMQALIRAAAAGGEGAPAWFVSSAHPRLVNGKPSKNPRYLQLRPDLADPRSAALATLSTRLRRRLGPTEPLYTPVNLVVPGRRNNPPEAGIRPLAVFNPIHYLELPELFMEFISSMTGKSPSTTGAGSEGALTKGPFNALPPIIDLNATLVSLILTGHDVFVSAAGYVGPKVRVDHDVSMLIPEVFSRMAPGERDARALIAAGCLERCADFEHKGQKVLASRLGYRINTRFTRIYFGRVFAHPHVVFTDEMLRPELQDMDVFADGMDNICATHKRVAEAYFADGSIAFACPPLKALLEIMARGQTADGKDLDDPTVRALFTREHLLGSAWYAARLDAKQTGDRALWTRHVGTLEAYVAEPANAEVVDKLGLRERLKAAKAEAARVSTPDYRKSLVGTLGTQPLG